MFSKGYHLVDVIFVSPLSRALYTTAQIIQIHKIQCPKIIVLPDLTEVLSKICDFSGDIYGKITKYSSFDFQ